MAWDEKLEISRAVNVVFYEVFHFSVVPEYIAAVCDFYSSANDVAGAMKDTRKTKYRENFNKSEFTSVASNSDERSQCVMFCEVLQMSHSR